MDSDESIRKFQRARKPEEIAIRRETILKAAAELSRGGVSLVTLIEISKLTSLPKSTIYTYFKSKEEVLIGLYIQDMLAMTLEIETGCKELSKRDAPGLASLLAKTYKRHPRFCETFSILATQIIKNISNEVRLELREVGLVCATRSTLCVRNVIPDLSDVETFSLLRTIATYVCGLYPFMSTDEMFREDMYDNDASLHLERVIEILINGMTRAR